MCEGLSKISSNFTLHLMIQESFKFQVFFLGFNPPPGGPGGQGGDVTAQDQEKVHQHQISFFSFKCNNF